ncbi:MAG: peptidyl-prolyl cis-trans isomerase [Planctomycetales bacterium]
MIKSVVREPLFQFLVLGGALFGVWLIRKPQSTPTEPSRPQILITESRIDSLIDQFAKTRQRPPTPQELRGLVDDFLQEEMFYREALAMGLDKDDSIVRRRLRQKMELLVEDLISAAQPTEQQLAQFLEDHADQFRVDQRVALRQVFLNPEKHPDGLEQAIAELKGSLDAHSNPEEHGDPFLLPALFELTSVRQLTQMFGGEFGQAVFALKAGEWLGPISSAYGEHLVFVDAKDEGRLPALDEIRPAVELEWFARRRADAKRDFYEKLRARYEITIETRDEPARGKELPP